MGGQELGEAETGDKVNYSYHFATFWAVVKKQLVVTPGKNHETFWKIG